MGCVETHFDWESTPVALPTDLGVLWTRYGEGEQRFDTKQLLKLLPHYAELPRRPQLNNLDGRSKLDKVLTVQQQTVLHIHPVHYCNTVSSL